MALVHDFILIDKDTDIMNISIEDKIYLDDCLIQYISDSIVWVRTYWNKGKEIKQGLNYYGYTIFKEGNITDFKNIIISWKNLFNNATETFKLTGNFLPDENKYDRNVFLKEEVLNNLEKIIKLCDIAITSDKYILHIGI